MLWASAVTPIPNLSASNSACLKNATYKINHNNHKNSPNPQLGQKFFLKKIEIPNSRVFSGLKIIKINKNISWDQEGLHLDPKK